MKILSINPRWCFAEHDLIGSGIPYWPISLASFNWLAKMNGHEVEVVDLPALNLNKFETQDKISMQGEKIQDVQFQSVPEAVVVYAMAFTAITEINNIVKFFFTKYNVPIFVLENTQAVTGFNLVTAIKSGDLKTESATILSGNPYVAFSSFLTNMSSKIRQDISSVDIGNYWEKYQIDSYNQLPYSHGPKRNRFIPLITSWGCPYGCDFCVVPRTNNRKWKGKTAKFVLSEIENSVINYNIHDFQIEDLNPTVNWKRWNEICDGIIEKELNITYSIVSGTKAETIPIEASDKLYNSGCRYISISPESGSKRLMKSIGKNFNHQHGLELIASLSKSNIKTQACFLVGHPKETYKDKLLTIKYLVKMLRAGVDEVAVFTVAPLPGSALSDLIVRNNSNITTFSGHGRKIDLVDKFQRLILISIFLTWQITNPKRIARILRGLFNSPASTKVENTFRRVKFIWKHQK